MRVKFFTVFLITFLLFVAAIVWRVDQILFADKLAWSEAQARSQMSALVQAVQSDLKSMRYLLALGGQEPANDNKEFASTKMYSRFQMFAKVTPPASGSSDWQWSETFYREKNNVKTWAPTYVGLALKTIKPSEIREGGSYLASILDPQRKPYILLIQNPGKDQSQWYLGLLPASIFQGLLDQQKGQMSSVYLVNQSGQALGHSIAEYIGSMLSEDPVVAEISKNGLASGVGVYYGSRGESIQGLYEQVEGTNLFTVVTTPVQSLLQGRDFIRGQFVLMGLGLALVGLAIFMLLFKDSPPAPMQSHLPANPVPSMPIVIKPGNAQANDRMSAYKQVASSLSHELKSPLTTIIAHLRLVVDHVPAKEKEHVQLAQRQAEEARSMIQKLLIFTGEDQTPIVLSNLETVVQKALKSVEAKIMSKGIRLNKKISAVPEFTMPSDLLARAIENVLLNSIEAMERAAQKELVIELKSEGSDIILNISDTGEGINAADMGKIFDPFFTTRIGSQHVGLGLSTALGIVRDAYGDIEVQSEKSKGTKVKMIFRPQQNILSSTEKIAEKTPDTKSVLSAPAAPAGPVDVLTLNENPEARTILNVSPLLVDNMIEKMLEGADLEDSLSDRKVDNDKVKFPPTPNEAHDLFAMQEKVSTGAVVEPDEKTEVLSVEESNAMLGMSEPSSSFSSSFSSKIDKPQIELKKKNNKLDQMSVSIRRPGE